ncbi:hypothetical protein FGIG_00435 [Fasciola gigantica]|uniref:Uncharacterized protein n=1 Tax=Fasciola gigantica TaxID=46835 RepID=A0A504Y6S3_FASGI|nr:hypothetical protein FGIG_00435 [Fasciola gigantica]
MQEWMFRYQVLCRQLNSGDQDKFSTGEQTAHHPESVTGPSTKRQCFFNNSEKDQPTTQSSDTPIQARVTMLMSADQPQQTQRKPELVGLAVDPCENTLDPVPQVFAPYEINHGACATNTFHASPINLHSTQHVPALPCWQPDANPPVPNFYGKRSLWHANSNPCPHTAPPISIPCCNTCSCPTCAFGMTSCAKASLSGHGYPYDHRHLCSSGSSHDHRSSGDCYLSSMRNSMCYTCQRYKQMASTNGICNSFEWTALPTGCCRAAAMDAVYPRLVHVPWKEGSLPNGSSNTTGTYPYLGSGSGGQTEGSELNYCCACWAKQYAKLTYKKTTFMTRDHPMHSSRLFAQTFAPKRDTVDFAVSNWCNSQKRPTHIPVGSGKPPGDGHNPPELTGMTATGATHPSVIPTLSMTDRVRPAALASQMVRVIPTQASMPTVIPGPIQASKWICHTLPTKMLKSANAVTCDGIQSLHMNHPGAAHNILQPCLNKNEQTSSPQGTAIYPETTTKKTTATVTTTGVQPDSVFSVDALPAQKDCPVRRKMAHVSSQPILDDHRVPQPVTEKAKIEQKQPWEVTEADFKAPDTDKVLRQNYYGLLFQCENTRQTCSSSVAATTSSASRFRPSESMDLESTEERFRQCISDGRLRLADERLGLLDHFTSNADNVLHGINGARLPNWLVTSA